MKISFWQCVWQCIWQNDEYSCIWLCSQQHIHHAMIGYHSLAFVSNMASGGNVPGFPGRDQISQLKAELDSNLKQIQKLEWKLHQLTKTGPSAVVASPALVAATQQNIQNLRARNSVVINHLDRIA